MSDVGQKMRYLMNSTQAMPYEEIIPVPDFRILHETDKYVLVESPDFHRAYEVLSFLRCELTGNWKLLSWQNVTAGDVTDQENPHKNERGQWVWLVESQ